MDGILTTFALLAAVAGSGGTSPALTLVIGISTVLADGLSMGAGEYLSAKAGGRARREQLGEQEAEQRHRAEKSVNATNYGEALFEGRCLLLVAAGGDLRLGLG